MSPSSHLYREHPDRAPLGECGHRGVLRGRVGTAGGRGGAGRFQPRVPVAAGLGFVCRMDIVMSNERRTRDVMCQPPSFSLRRKIRLLRCVPACGALAPEAPAGAQGCAGAACRAQARGSGPGGAGARGPAPAPPAPSPAASAVQFGGSPTGAAFAERIRGRQHERAARPGRRWRRGEGLGPGAGGEGPAERAGLECSPPLVPVWCPRCPSEFGSPWSPGLGAPVSSQGLGELGVG